MARAEEALMTARRNVLKGGVVLAAAAAAAAGIPRTAGNHAPLGPLRYLVDLRLPEAAHLAERARLGGQDLHDPRCEIVTLLLSPEWQRQAGAIIGLTTWSDFALAHDILRASATPIRHAEALEGPNPGLVSGVEGSPTQRMLAELLGPLPRHPARRATSFLWLA